MIPNNGQIALALELQKLRILADFNRRREAAQAEMLALFARVFK